MAMRQIEVRYIEETPLDVCLDLWVRWCQRDDLGLGWRGRSAMLEGGGAAHAEQIYDRRDMQTAEAMDAMIAGLKTHHMWAIRRRCGLATVWSFPRLVFSDVLEQAEKNLIEAMQKNLATRIYFK